MSGAISASTVAMVGMSAGTGLNVAGSIRQSQATKQAYNYQATVSRNNAMIAEWQAQDALRRGASAEQSQRLRTAQTIGSQRARLAANGVALDQGSALNILDDTKFLGELDANTIKDNAAKEAWGYRTQGTNYRNDAAMLKSRANAENPALAGFSTLLTGAGAVSDSWYRYNSTRST